jgi:serine/threonine protein kinase
MHLTTDTCIRADFGISKKFAADELSQTSGLIALTRKYCSPEVYDGEPRGRAADVFSLGCVFLEIATVIQGLRSSATFQIWDGSGGGGYHRSWTSCNK